MDVLDQLAVALGLATLAGVNLYLVVFVTGMAVQFQWITLAERYASLGVLGEPVVIGVAGAMLLIEVLADKVPWIDSTWDTFHTLIRPVGGGLLAISALGTSRPEFDVIIALVAGSATMVSHGFKAGTRLVVNTSPEPVSNFLVSTAEDVAVVGGLVLMYVSPMVSLALCAIFLAFAIYAMPKMFRRIKGFYWLLSKNLTGWMAERQEELPCHLSPEEDMALTESYPGGNPEVLWCVQVLTGRSIGLKGVRPFSRGALVSVREGAQSRLYFLAHKMGGVVCHDLEITKRKVTRETRLMSEDLIVYGPDKTLNAVFRLPLSQSSMARRTFQAVTAS